MNELKDLSEAKEFEHSIDLVPGNVQTLLSQDFIRNRDKVDFRDTSIIILRHADEKEDKDAETLGISTGGEEQIIGVVDEIANSMEGITEDVIIKFYSSPTHFAKYTARRIIDEIDKRLKSNNWPGNALLLKASSGRQVPRKRESVARDTRIAKDDVQSILTERSKRRGKGEEVEFSTILIERDKEGQLHPDTEGKDSIANRLRKAVESLQKINERIPAEGEKLLFIIVTHNVYFQALLDQDAKGCRGVRIDLPLKKGEKLVLVGVNGSKELEW